jgi:signal peptidase I
MTPKELLTIVAVFAAARIALSLRPVAARSAGRSVTLAREYLDPFIVAGLTAWVLITFVARTYYIPSGSMEPTLHIHDVLLVDKIEYRFHPPHRGDIVVFPPPIPTPDDFIKRIIGLPGDRFSIMHGTVFIDGKPLDEPYIKDKPNYELKVADYGIEVNDGYGWHFLDPSEADIPPRRYWTAPDRIPPHCYFMMGDNRNDSEDSHIWGFAQDAGRFYTGPRAGKPAYFTGRAFLIFWPPQDFRFLTR